MKTNYVKRTQKDYPLSLKLQIVESIECGSLSTSQAVIKYGVQSRTTVVKWLRKYGNFDWEHQNPLTMLKTDEQKSLELEVKVKLLEKQNSVLEKQISNANTKAILFDMMIDLAEKEYTIPIRKKCKPE